VKLRDRDSNPKFQIQRLACCQLHHPAIGSEKDSQSASGTRSDPLAAFPGAPHAPFFATQPPPGEGHVAKNVRRGGAGCTGTLPASGEPFPELRELCEQAVDFAFDVWVDLQQVHRGIPSSALDGLPAHVYVEWNATDLRPAPPG
jgi:hypothetical protein